MLQPLIISPVPKKKGNRQKRGKFSGATKKWQANSPWVYHTAESFLKCALLSLFWICLGELTSHFSALTKQEIKWTGGFSLFRSRCSMQMCYIYHWQNICPEGRKTLLNRDRFNSAYFAKILTYTILSSSEGYLKKTCVVYSMYLYD